MMPINEYLKQVNTKYKAGNATKHTYRGYLQTLIESLVKGISATNEPARLTTSSRVVIYL